uniref:Smr domain-containing protein n=1 Tax=Tetradesmus obliquus TaxID=3088 RepID=A0A383VHL1_TETOB|eukprot:jgi/Sobl393_1/5497/SZX64423.1
MSSLRPTATAFVPSFSSAAASRASETLSGNANGAAADQQQQQQQQQAEQAQLFEEQEEYEDEEENYDDGYYDENGDWVQYEADDYCTEDWQQLDNSIPWEQQQLATQQQEQEEAAWQDTYGHAEQAALLLHSWFPSQPLPLLRQLLEACDGRLQEALQIVSEMDEQQQQQQQQVKSHAQSTSSAKAPPQQRKIQQQLSLQDDASFPALSAAAEQQKTGAAATARPAADSASTLWDGKAATHARTGSSSWSALAKAAAAAAPSGIPASNPAVTGRAAANNSHTKAASGRAAAEQHAVPWVQTGEAVAQEYAAARAEASDYARIRNACFQQATQAYLAGNKALAKELSAKGKAAAQHMFAAHELASQQIYTQRNTQLAASAATAAQRGSSAAAVIDLHGLHVREVQSLLPKQLAAFQQQQQQSVNIIVGTGHHTKGPPSARVGPAVEALLQELGLSYKRPQPGLLRVHLS